MSVIRWPNLPDFEIPPNFSTVSL